MAEKLMLGLGIAKATEKHTNPDTTKWIYAR